MVVRADEPAGRERVGHQQRRGAVAAAEVGDGRAALELGLDAVQRRDPLGQQVHQVPRAEEPLAAGEDVLVVLTPAVPGPGAERLLDVVLRLEGAERELVGTRQEHRAGRVGQGERLLGRHRVRRGGGVVLDVAAGRLAAQPLVDVPRVGVGRGGHGAGVAGLLGEGAVQAQPLTEQHVAGTDGGAEVADELADERHQGVHVDGRSLGLSLFDGGHVRVSRAGASRVDAGGGTLLGSPLQGGCNGDAMTVAGGWAHAGTGTGRAGLRRARRRADRLRDLRLRGTGRRPSDGRVRADRLVRAEPGVEGQVPYLAQHYRVVTIDPRGNGRSDRPTDPAAYGDLDFVGRHGRGDGRTSASDRAVLVGICVSAWQAMLVASLHPERVQGVVAVGPWLYDDTPAAAVPGGGRARTSTTSCTSYEGWTMGNRHFIADELAAVLRASSSTRCCREPHSTKQLEDILGLDRATRPGQVHAGRARDAARYPADTARRPRRCCAGSPSRCW